MVEPVTPDGALQAILARPLDDAPRLALAEALSCAGDPRGELIVVQCKLGSKGLERAKRASITRRERELVALHGETWVRHVAGLGSARLRRGFVDAVESPAHALVAKADALFANEPVTSLTVTEANAETLEALDSAGAFRRILRLTVRGPIGTDGAKALARALAQRDAPLAALNVGSNDLAWIGLESVVATLEGCRKLVLTDNALGDDGLAAFAKAKKLGSLEVLFLTKNELSDEGLVALAKSSGLPALTRLGVARNDEITPEGLRAVAESKKLRRLRWLEYTDPDAFGERVAVR